MIIAIAATLSHGAHAEAYERWYRPPEECNRECHPNDASSFETKILCGQKALAARAFQAAGMIFSAAQLCAPNKKSRSHAQYLRAEARYQRGRDARGYALEAINIDRENADAIALMKKIDPSWVPPAKVIEPPPSTPWKANKSHAAPPTMATAPVTSNAAEKLPWSTEVDTSPAPASKAASPLTPAALPSANLFKGRVIDYTKVQPALSKDGGCRFKFPFDLLASPLIMKEPIARDDINQLLLYNEGFGASSECVRDSLRDDVYVQFYVYGDSRSYRDDKCSITISVGGRAQNKGFVDRIYIRRHTQYCDGKPEGARFLLADEMVQDGTVWIHGGKLYLSKKDLLAAGGAATIQLYDQRKAAESQAMGRAQAAVLGGLVSIATRGKLDVGGVTLGGAEGVKRAAPAAKKSVLSEPKKAAPSTPVNRVSSVALDGKTSTTGFPTYAVSCSNGDKHRVYHGKDGWYMASGVTANGFAKINDFSLAVMDAKRVAELKCR